MPNHTKLIPAQELLSNILRSIRRSKRRIYLQTMILGSDEVMAPLHWELKKASSRGVEVYMAIDTFTASETFKSLDILRYRERPFRRTLALQKQLNKSGISFRWLGESSPIIVAGRTHSKWVIVDDEVYCFGGVNLYREGLANKDFMLKIRDEELADRLIVEQERIVRVSRRGRFYRSYSFASKKGEVMIDGGVLGNSLIYDQACSLAKQAKAITYVSQYCPSGQLGRILRRKDAKIYFNNWRLASPFNSFVIGLGVLLSGHQTLYGGDGYIHAKYMIFEFVDGSKRAITGSHNFSNGGVWMGTREIALDTADKEIISQLERFTERYISS